MAATFSLANETFTIGLEAIDVARRREYFRNGSTSLSVEEKRILETLGIDSALEQTMSPYLADFFDALPKCHTDTQIMLNKSCEVPYYVLWTTQFANRHMTESRIAKQKKDGIQSRNLLTMANDGEIIKGLLGNPVKADSITSIFTLIPVGVSSTSATSVVLSSPKEKDTHSEDEGVQNTLSEYANMDKNTPNAVDSIFTLIRSD